MSFPNLLIAGFPKCGTTSLHHYLSEHPQIYMPKQKELHFFTHKILSKQIGGKGDEITSQLHVNCLDKYKSFFHIVNFMVIIKVKNNHMETLMVDGEVVLLFKILVQK